MNYNISGEPLNELRASTKDNPSGIFSKEELKSLWAYIQEYCRIGANKYWTHFRFESAGEIYDVDIINKSLAIYKHNWKP